jgi:signal transduction histidine kinase
MNEVFARISEDVRRLVLKAIDDIHRISYNLRPLLLDNFGLVSALRWFVQDFHERTGIKVELSVESELEALPSSLELLVFRVTQEALTNVSRHASATQASVLFTSSEQGVRLVIEDNGKGFDVREVMRRRDGRGGLGIFGMKERVSTFNGILTILSSEQKGTKLVVEFASDSIKGMAI